MSGRIISAVIVVMLGGLTGGIAPAAAGQVLPVIPRSLVLPRSELPGFAKAKQDLEAAATITGWTNGVLQDPPVNAAEEQARLQEEGFREGVRDVYTAGRNIGISAAVLFGSAAAARNEASFKEREEMAELGVGATRFPVSAIPGAVGIQQAHLKQSLIPGLYNASVVFPQGQCTAVVAVAITKLATAHRTAVAGAVALKRKLANSPCA